MFIINVFFKNRIKLSFREWFQLLVLIFVTAPTESDPVTTINQTVPTRRIMNGKSVGDTRPYMVYLRPAPEAEAQLRVINWLCGGVIIHERYILTSAACIEDAKHFYVVSGTHKWLPVKETNDCIKNGAKKAVWKCVPNNYYYDGAEFENIRWLSGDIAVVKIEDHFNFEKRVLGCDYIPKAIPFNNISLDQEKPGTKGSIAGWGSIEKFTDIDAPANDDETNSRDLLETDAIFISKKSCKKHWDQRYHHIIDEDKICTRAGHEEQMSQACIDQGISCKELEYIAEYDDETEDKNVKMRAHKDKTAIARSRKLKELGESRRFDIDSKIQPGGFCENDHGGPLVVGHGTTSIVVGVISACNTKAVTRNCYGPFLYTSVWAHRNLISCAIDKDISPSCRRSLQKTNNEMIETVFDWSQISDKFPEPAETTSSGF